MRRNKGLFTGMMLFGAGLAVLSAAAGGPGGERRGGMLMGTDLISSIFRHWPLASAFSLTTLLDLQR